jgi:hypothetical protein
MTITAELHDGTRLEFPDGTDSAVIQKAVQGVIAKQSAPQASQQAGSTLREIPRQIGLTARYGLEGLGGLADVVANPIRQLAVNPVLRGLGLPQASSLTDAATSLSDAVGLPSPQNADERTVGDATRTLASAGGMAGGAAKLAARYAPGMAQNVLQTLAARPGMQMAGAATAGASGGSVREAGGSPGEQFAASLAGGLAGGAAAAKTADLASAGTNAIRNMLTPKTAQIQQADQAISLILERQGADWSQVPERIKQGMREEVAAAMTAGQPLNADAVRRLLIMRRAGVTPTVGQLTQDPGQITREQNLAKTGANSTDPTLQRLPALQNQNTATLLRGLDDAGAANAPSMADTGSRAINSLDSNLAREGASRNALYQAARDSEGRSVVLDGAAAAQVAMRRLQESLAGKLPPEIDKILNDLTAGNTPLTVDYQQQLVRALGDRIRGSGADGTLRHGLGIVRSALDNADVIPTNPGNLPVPYGTATAPGQQAGEDAIAAFRAARNAHRELMQRIEANPALRAVSDGVEPDQFVQRYVIGKGTTVADVQALRDELSPEATQSMRQTLVRYLRDKATGGDADIVKFGGKTYRDAFRDIQDKLPTFFNHEEIQQLRDIGDAAKYMQSQPAGAAVNNSNSGALVLGRGLDMLERIAQKMPVGRDAITGVLQGAQQRQVMAPRNALIGLAQKSQEPATNPLLAAAVALPPRKKDRRD